MFAGLFTNVMTNTSVNHFSAFDECVESYKVYKVETIGDGYVVASGLPERIGDRHSYEIAAMALNMMALSVNYTLPGSDIPLPLRIGVNAGMLSVK